MKTKKKILILNTGGTISCVRTPQGFAPQPKLLAQTLEKILSLRHADMPSIDIHEYEPLLDSSNIGLKEWNQMATDIAKYYHQYAGFVILHGTDTMAYTASALSFMLENLNKPVILTGSQIPLIEARNDAIDNLVSSLWLSAHAQLNEVCIYFDHKLLRGNRARKLNAQSMTAFESPNYPELADIGIHIHLHQNLCLPSATDHFRLQTLTPQHIINFRLFPGFSTKVMQLVLQQPIAALILETYGSGNAPSHSPEFLAMLQQADAQHIILVNCTQCLHGQVEMEQYETGYALKKLGMISGFDMTPEAIHCKLLYLLSKYTDKSIVKDAMQKNLRGELSALNSASTSR